VVGLAAAVFYSETCRLKERSQVGPKIIHAIKLEQVLQDLHNCAVNGCKLKQNANEGCNSCASLAGLVLSFIVCIILLVIAPDELREL